MEVLKKILKWMGNFMLLGMVIIPFLSLTNIEYMSIIENYNGFGIALIILSVVTAACYIVKRAGTTAAAFFTSVAICIVSLILGNKIADDFCLKEGGILKELVGLTKTYFLLRIDGIAIAVMACVRLGIKE